MFVTFVLIIMFSSVGILVCEQQNPGAKIKNAEDAVWWSVATITTVGYGDLYPVTSEGRCLAMLLMISGVGMFGAVSGIVASSLLGARKTESPDNAQIVEWLKRIEAKVDRLNQERDSPR